MKMTMWIKALLALAPAALFIATPAPARADGACTALANPDDIDAYNECVFRANAYCKGRSTGFYVDFHVTCKYPDGGRDECDERLRPLSGGRFDFINCTYVPPGSEPAPAPAGEPS